MLGERGVHRVQLGSASAIASLSGQNNCSNDKQFQFIILDGFVLQLWQNNRDSLSL